MNTRIRSIEEWDRESIIDIFNFYVENSFAAYPESKLPYEAFDIFRQFTAGYPTGVVEDPNGKILGFAMLRPHHPLQVFSRTAEFSCFIHKDFTGSGFGEMLLFQLENEALELGIKNILASISSLNSRSIAFHARHGFIERGRFKNVGMKNGQIFDTVWMQKKLED